MERGSIQMVRSQPMVYYCVVTMFEYLLLEEKFIYI